jgi:hypothetical protein
MAGHVTQAMRHALKARREDFYATPREAVDSLLRLEALPNALWDPCCGDGAIVKPLREAGFRVHASDLNDFGCPDSEIGHDFLMPFSVPDRVDGIVMNPPFKAIEAFLSKALIVAPFVAMLARLAFLEGATRGAWFQSAPLARVWVSSRRLPMMHRNGWDGPRTGSAIAFAWYIFEAEHSGPPRLGWFDWRLGR